MSTSKYFDRIAIVVTALTLVVTILFMNGAKFGIEATAHTLGYEERLFDNSKVHSIDIVMNDWDGFIDNAKSEEYYSANVIIDGESYKNVAIRAKGNTSLSTVSSLGSERYSFKIEFDHYDKTKTYYGLDKLSLNNLIQDSTMMKDYLTYTLMNEFGVNSSLSSYVYITVNGEDWGLYLAVEGVEEAFLERNYGSDYGELYKPDSMSFGGGRGNGKDFDMGDFNFDDIKDGFDFDSLKDNFGDKNNLPDMPENFDSSNIFGGDKKGGFGGGMGSSDVKLQYIDDELDSYSNIWNNAKTDITENDQNRLISSLKKLSDNEDISSVVDVEQVIRYFVVHNFVCNGDSYTGSMVHNYYLYEKDGKLAMIPWDYNLAFGTFQGGNAVSTVNTPIDSPVDNGSGDDRPMWYWIVSNEEYTKMYHEYFTEFLSSANIDTIIENAYTLIKDYVEKDPTAFYSTEEFELGVETLRKFCALRSQSISKQLENGETAENKNYVNASGITLSDMGSMGKGTGGTMPNVPESPSDKGDFNSSDFSKDSVFSFESNTSLQPLSLSLGGNGDGGGQNGFPGNMPGDFDPSNMPSDFDPSNMPNGDGNFPGQPPDSANGNMPSDIPSDIPSGSVTNGTTTEETTDSTTNDTTSTTDETTTDRTDDSDKQKPGSNSPFDIGKANTPTNLTAWLWIAVSVIILAVGLIIAKKYKA